MIKTIEAEIRPAKLMYSMALNSLGFASCATEEWEKKHHLVAGVVFAAFTFEAMINHYARVVLSDWKEIEERKKLRKREPFHVYLFESVNLPEYTKKDPYLIILRCIHLRDRFAHGKTTDEIFTTQIQAGLSGQEECHQVLNALTQIEQECNEMHLQLFIDAILQVEKDIETNGKYPADHPNRPGEQLLECPLSVTGVRMW